MSADPRVRVLTNPSVSSDHHGTTFDVEYQIENATQEWLGSVVVNMNLPSDGSATIDALKNDGLARAALLLSQVISHLSDKIKPLS